MADLNTRSVTFGIGIGACLGVANVYLGMKAGFWDAGAITASILGYAFLSLRAGGGVTPGETNVTQALAASVATVPSVMGLVGAVPAMAMMGTVVAPATLVGWALVLGLLGIVIAALLRATFIEHEALPFPTGRAVAELIKALHGQAALARTQTRALLVAAAVAAALVWLRDGSWAVIPAVILSPWAPAAVPATLAQIGLAVSPALIATGTLIGPRVGLSLLAGGVVAWLVLAPALLAGSLAQASYESLATWLLWPGVGLLVGGGLAALGAEWRTLGRLAGDLRNLARRGSAPLVVGAVLTGAGVVAVARLGFGVPVVLAVAGLVIAVPFISAFARTVGQTDVAQYAALGQGAQGTLAAIARAPAVVNAAAASIASGAAAETVQLLYAFRVGHALDTPPRRLIVAQLIGLGVGALVAALAYTFLVRAHGVGTPALPVPASASWKAMGLVAENGLSALPPGALLATAIGFAAAVVLGLLERSRFAGFVPSPAGLGIGFLVPFAAVAALAVGGVASGRLGAWAPAWSERYLLPVASGGIVGESLAAVAIALVMTTA